MNENKNEKNNLGADSESMRSDVTGEIRERRSKLLKKAVAQE